MIIDKGENDFCVFEQPEQFTKIDDKNSNTTTQKKAKSK